MLNGAAASWKSERQVCRTILHFDVSALHLLPTKVVPHVHVLATSGRHAILVECDTTMIILVNGDPESW
jgi:hypothetical protein